MTQFKDNQTIMKYYTVILFTVQYCKLSKLFESSAIVFLKYLCSSNCKLILLSESFRFEYKNSYNDKI